MSYGIYFSFSKFSNPITSYNWVYITTIFNVEQILSTICSDLTSLTGVHLGKGDWLIDSDCVAAVFSSSRNYVLFLSSVEQFQLCIGLLQFDQNND